MTIRKGLFWLHLTAGVVAGAIVLLMSVTGVLLAFEKQVIHAAEAREFAVVDTGERLPLELLAEKSRSYLNVEGDVTLTFTDDRSTGVLASTGRRGPKTFIDPYTGEELSGDISGTEEFFGFNMRLHRWLAMDGDRRTFGKSVTGIANLMFVFMIVSGLILWFPKRLIGSLVKQRAYFMAHPPTAKARDWNWHHVIGIWCMVPLFFIATTAVVFSYPWANDLVRSVFSEPDEEQSSGTEPGASVTSPSQSGDDIVAEAGADQVLAKAMAQVSGWRKMSVIIPNERAGEPVHVNVAFSIATMPTREKTLVYDPITLELINTESFGDQPRASQARVYIRFLHTGETFGWIGQLIAAIASVGACFLTYTGMALAYRRLILTPKRRKRQQAS